MVIPLYVDALDLIQCESVLYAQYLLHLVETCCDGGVHVPLYRAGRNTLVLLCPGCLRGAQLIALQYGNVGNIQLSCCTICAWKLAYCLSLAPFQRSTLLAEDFFFPFFFSRFCVSRSRLLTARCQAFKKMNNVLIDDRRIRVDFSQSVAKEW